MSGREMGESKKKMAKARGCVRVSKESEKERERWTKTKREGERDGQDKRIGRERRDEKGGRGQTMRVSKRRGGQQYEKGKGDNRSN